MPQRADATGVMGIPTGGETRPAVALVGPWNARRPSGFARVSGRASDGLAAIGGGATASSGPGVGLRNRSDDPG